MGQMITVTGMVLAAYPYGDYDKRITLLTKERGKITAFARGARKQNSPLLAVCNSFVTGDFTVYEGRSSYNLMQAKARNYFHELSADFAGACYGFYFCELADYYTREASDELPMLKLLYQTLRALLRPSIPDELIRYIYFDCISMRQVAKMLGVSEGTIRYRKNQILARLKVILEKMMDLSQEAVL